MKSDSFNSISDKNQNKTEKSIPKFYIPKPILPLSCLEKWESM